MGLLGAYQEVRKGKNKSGIKEKNENIAKILEDNKVDIIELVKHLGENLVQGSLVETINKAYGDQIEKTTITIAKSFLSKDKIKELEENKEETKYKELDIKKVKKYKTIKKKQKNGKIVDLKTNELELDENGNEIMVDGQLFVSYWGKPSITISQIKSMLKNNGIEIQIKNNEKGKNIYFSLFLSDFFYYGLLYYIQ